MLSIIFVVVCSLFQWNQIWACFLSFVYFCIVVGDLNNKMGRFEIPLTGLTPPHIVPVLRCLYQYNVLGLLVGLVYMPIKYNKLAFFLIWTAGIPVLGQSVHKLVEVENRKGVFTVAWKYHSPKRGEYGVVGVVIWRNQHGKYLVILRNVHHHGMLKNGHR